MAEIKDDHEERELLDELVSLGFIRNLKRIGGEYGYYLTEKGQKILFLLEDNYEPPDT